MDCGCYLYERLENKQVTSVADVGRRDENTSAGNRNPTGYAGEPESSGR